MKTTRVTGCVVTHNNIRSIEKTLESLLEHTTGVEFKLFVVDNSSTDGTPELIREKFPAVELIETGENRGFGAGHNVVLSRLDSDYHAIINPDIDIQQDVVAALAAFLDANEDIGLASPKICFPDGRPQILGKRNPTLRYLAASRLRGSGEPGKILREYAMLDEDDTKPFDIENATGCFMMLRTGLFKQAGGFDEHYFMYLRTATRPEPSNKGTHRFLPRRDRLPCSAGTAKKTRNRCSFNSSPCCTTPQSEVIGP